jgi:hypothetical protein
MSSEQSPADKLLNERKLFDAMQSKVIDRAIQIKVDNGPHGTFSTLPGEVLVKATKQLCNDVGGEELTNFKIDRTLEDIVIKDSWGSFYYDSENKRHLRLNPEGWGDRNKKTSRPPPTGFTVGPLV